MDEQDRMLLSESHERSTEALSKIKGHEILCEERYKGIDSKLKDIKEYQYVLNSRMWGAVSIIITLLLSIFGYMLAKGFDHIIASTTISEIMVAIFEDLS